MTSFNSCIKPIRSSVSSQVKYQPPFHAMANFLSQLAIAALLITPATLAVAQSSGSGKTTRYWDCCKPSCAWNGIKGLTAPVKSCDKYDKPLNDVTAQSGCAGGTAYMCSNQSPWAVSDSLAYGFAAVTSAKPTCCQCYQLTFTSGPISGKKMIVQATNTGTDVATNSFDIAVSISILQCSGYPFIDDHGVDARWRVRHL